MFLLAICIPSLEKCLFSFYACFLIRFLFIKIFFLMSSCMSCLYVLNINPLSVILFANILSHFIGVFWFCCFFYYAKFLSLSRFRLFIFAFISFILEDKYENISLLLFFLTFLTSLKNFERGQVPLCSLWCLTYS